MPFTESMYDHIRKVGFNPNICEECQSIDKIFQEMTLTKPKQCSFSDYPCEKETCQGCRIREEAMKKINADIAEGVRSIWAEAQNLSADWRG